MSKTYVSEDAGQDQFGHRSCLHARGGRRRTFVIALVLLCGGLLPSVVAGAGE